MVFWKWCNFEVLCEFVAHVGICVEFVLTEFGHFRINSFGCVTRQKHVEVSKKCTMWSSTDPRFVFSLKNHFFEKSNYQKTNLLFITRGFFFLFSLLVPVCVIPFFHYFYYYHHSPLFLSILLIFYKVVVVWRIKMDRWKVLTLVLVRWGTTMTMMMVASDDIRMNNGTM